MRTRAQKGTLAIFVAAVCYGFLGVLIKLALQAGVDVLPLAAWRFLLASAFVWVSLALRRRPVPEIRHWPGLAGVGTLYAVNALAFIVALQWIPASTAVLVFYVYPVVVVALAALFLHERLTPRRIAATGLTMAGCALTVGFGLSAGRPLGIALVLLAVLSLSAYILLSRPLMRHLPAHGSAAVTLSSTAAVMVVAALAFDGLALGGGTRGAVLVFTLSLFSTALPITLFLVGLKQVGAGRAAVFSTIEPVVTVIVAGIALGERIGSLQYLGGALILTGVLWLRSERPLPAREEPLPLEAP